MTTCYACEFKEYKQGNQIPSRSCPSDCTILQLFRGLGVSVRRVKELASLMDRRFADVNDFIVDLDDIERQGDLIEATHEIAYRKIYDWHKKNSDLIHKTYGKSGHYSDTYLKLVESLPGPRQATKEDMFFVSHQIKTMLMEWSYNQEDEHGKKMHEYASIIEKELENKDIDMTRSKLNQIVNEFHKRQ